MSTILERYNKVNEELKNREIEVHGYRVSMESAKEQMLKIADDLTVLEKQEKNIVYAIEEFKRISTERTEMAKQDLENVLNWVLSKIELQQRYTARIEESKGRGSKGLNIILQDAETGYERSISEQSGTALAQIISFLMIVIVIKFSGSSRIVVIDEVFSGIDDEQTVRMFGEILVALSENEGFQFIMVEHQDVLDEIEGMNVVKLSLKDYKKGTVIEEQYKKKATE